MAAGGAATGLTVLEFFEDIGIPIMEGYGLTETAPMVSTSEFLLWCAVMLLLGNLEVFILLTILSLCMCTKRHYWMGTASLGLCWGASSRC